MFFVEKFLNRKNKEFALIHWAPTIIILVTFFCVTLFAWHIANQRAKVENQTSLNNTVENVSAEISDQIDTFEAILRSGSGLVQTSGVVTRDQWKSFSKATKFEKKYPTINGMGFAPTVPNSQKDTFTKAVRQSDIKNFRIKPPGVRPLYVPVLYAESRDDSDSIPNALGEDLYVVPARKDALDHAAETGESALTGKVYSLAPTDSNPKRESIMIMYYPIFKDGKKTGSVADTTGFMFLGAKPDALFQAVLSDANTDTENYGQRIYIGNPSDKNLLYESDNFTEIASQQSSITQTKTFELQNVEWTLEVVASENAGTPEVQDRPEYILIIGSLLSVFVAMIVYVLLVSRTRVIAYKEEFEIQSAKDELLALASHQLRTPATGVKQYVGMLQEGYAGNLTPEQHNLLSKAYESNERQLNTINEMLSVARADTGRLPITKSKVNLNDMLADILSEQQKDFDDRQQKLRISIPKSKIFADIDPQYFRMAVENIISNATKYTPSKGEIDVTLQKKKSSIVVMVEDTGVGIPERHYPLLFKKFSRIPNDMTNQVSGTGIGLYLAKHIIEAHKGTLTFSSEAGVGSTFKISVPLRVSSNES